MLIFGVDPGVRNSGLALVRAGTSNKVLFAKSIVTDTGDWREALHSIFNEAPCPVEDEELLPVVESVVWYGRRRGMYELNRLVGALYASFELLYGECLLANPQDKIKLTKSLRGKAKNEHEEDAIALALYGIEWLKNLELGKTKQGKIIPIVLTKQIKST